MRMPTGALKILAEGICRAKVKTFKQNDDFIEVACDDLPTTNNDDSVETQALWRQISELYQTYTQFNEKAPAYITDMVKTPEDIDYIIDTIAVHVNNISFLERQEILELHEKIGNQNGLY